MSSRAIIKEGFLTKQGNVRKSWKMRWFILYGTNIKYFKGPGEKKALGLIKLTKEVAVDEGRTAAQPNRFLLRTHKRTYIICAETSDSRESWINAIRSTVHKLGGAPPVAASSSNDTSSTAAAAAAVSPAPSHPSASASTTTTATSPKGEKDGESFEQQKDVLLPASSRVNVQENVAAAAKQAQEATAVEEESKKRQQEQELAEQARKSQEAEDAAKAEAAAKAAAEKKAQKEKKAKEEKAAHDELQRQKTAAAKEPLTARGGPVASMSVSGNLTLAQSAGRSGNARKVAPNTISGGSLTARGGVNPNKKILLGLYQLGEKLGRGAVGTVWKGLSIRSGDFVAIKQIDITGLDKAELQALVTELELLRTLEHPNVVSLIRAIRTRDQLYFVMEYLEAGSLRKILRSFGPVSEPLIRNYISQALLGLEYLHGKGVIHRDIKCDNLLLTKSGGVKLADFGVATKVKHNADDMAPEEALGSPYWIAPEIIEMESSPTPACDIWSTGCTTIELFTGEPPNIEMPTMSAMFAIVSQGITDLPENASPDLTDFLRCCLQRKPADRPTATKLLSHPFLGKFARLDTDSATAAVPVVVPAPRGSRPSGPIANVSAAVLPPPLVLAGAGSAASSVGTSVGESPAQHPLADNDDDSDEEADAKDEEVQEEEGDNLEAEEDAEEEVSPAELEVRNYRKQFSELLLWLLRALEGNTRNHKQAQRLAETITTRAKPLRKAYRKNPIAADLIAEINAALDKYYQIVEGAVEPINYDQFSDDDEEEDEEDSYSDYSSDDDTASYDSGSGGFGGLGSQMIANI